MPSRTNSFLPPVGVVALSLAAMGCMGVVDPDKDAMGPRGTGGSSTKVDPNIARTQPVDPGHVPVHRLNTTEYNATVADVLGTKLQPANANWRGGELGGFDNMASVLGVDADQYRRYFDAADALTKDVFANDALRTRIVICGTQDDMACVASILNSTGSRIFRRPLTAAEVTTYFENGSAFNADGSSDVEPSHGRQPGAFLTCVDPSTIRKAMKVAEANAISLDQIMATHAAFLSKTGLPSLQLGLSTVLSYCDGQPCSNSRSVSWSGATTPMYKQVDPLEVFNKIVGVIKPSDNMGGNTAPDPEALNNIARNKSVIDAVLESATRTQAQLGTADKLRLQEFLDAVRAVEKNVTGVSMGMGGVACSAIAAPTMATVRPDAPKQNTAAYQKELHANAMNDLIVMAFQCDATRIITHMLEDERSEFTYDHVKKRTFTATGSTEGNGTCPEYHGGGQHGSQDDFASIVRWNAGKVAELATRLDAIKEADGSSILDNTVIFFGGAMHGSNHACNDLPVALIGGGALGLTQDQHVALGKRPLRDLHYTMMNKVFDMSDVATFGQDLTGGQLKVISEIIA